jgi:hypothetical protein
MNWTDPESVTFEAVANMLRIVDDKEGHHAVVFRRDGEIKLETFNAINHFNDRPDILARLKTWGAGMGQVGLAASRDDSWIRTAQQMIRSVSDHHLRPPSDGPEIIDLS